LIFVVLKFVISIIGGALRMTAQRCVCRKALFGFYSFACVYNRL
jgi:hypothetical protein